MLLPGTNFSRSTIFVLSTSSAFTSSAVKVKNWPRLYSYPLRTSRLSISSPVPGSCGGSVTGVAAGVCSPPGLPLSARSRRIDGAEPCCPPPRSGKSSSSISTGAGCHTWCKRMGFVRGWLILTDAFPNGWAGWDPHRRAAPESRDDGRLRHSRSGHCARARRLEANLAQALRYRARHGCHQGQLKGRCETDLFALRIPGVGHVGFVAECGQRRTNNLDAATMRAHRHLLEASDHLRRGRTRPNRAA